MRGPFSFSWILVPLAFMACEAQQSAPKPPVIDAAPPKPAEINEEGLRAHIAYLASDDMEGRAAGFPGNEKAVTYLVEKLTAYGLKPAGEKGSYLQVFTDEKNRIKGTKQAKNVLAMIEGSDPRLKEEFVTVGGHLDHVGIASQKVGGQKGGPTADDKIWNGADDNGSGTAAILEIARFFAAGKDRPRRSILFCFWNAEEQGLIGSRYWTNHPTVPLDKVVYNLNLDMIGRNPEQPVHVEGVKNAAGPALEEIITLAFAAEDAKITKYDHHHEAMFRSDGSNFLRKEIAATMLFTYWHDDYHRVSDHVDGVAYPNLAKITRASVRILRAIADRDERLRFNPDTPLNR